VALARDGTVRGDPRYNAYAVTTAAYQPATEHTIAAPFWEFMHMTGLVYEQRGYTEAALFPHPYYATGYPITEPYWVTIAVADTPHDVLVQCFERRCLTYTPANDEGWRVESGNIGQHYYAWRYAGLGTED
jgi:hypothetical protein